MPRGRPKKDGALSHAERQALYRQRVTKNQSVTEIVTEIPAETITPAPDPFEAVNHVTEIPLPVATVAEVVTSSVTYVDKLKVEPGLLRDRMALRAWLDVLREEWTACQRVGDYAGCRRVNDEREPLFEAIWALEKDLPDRYWFPSRIQNVGQSFAK